MNALPFGAQARAGRECDCPPQVTRCVHFGDKILAFTSPEERVHVAGLAEHQKRCNPVPYFKFNVGTTSRYAPCPGGCGAIFATRPGVSHYEGDDEADALAAFYRAEEELLRGAA